RVLEPVGDVLGGGQIGKQRIGLEHDAEVTLGRRQRRDVSLVLLDAAAGLDIEARDRAQERRLAATRRAQEADELALGDLERDVGEGRQAAQLLGVAADPKIRRHWSTVL